MEKIQKGRARILSSGKVVGDPGNWNAVRDRKEKGNNLVLPSAALQLTTVVENKFEALVQEECTMAEYNDKQCRK